jgi:hypothetical protein
MHTTLRGSLEVLPGRAPPHPTPTPHPTPPHPTPPHPPPPPPAVERAIFPTGSSGPAITIAIPADWRQQVSAFRGLTVQQGGGGEAMPAGAGEGSPGVWGCTQGGCMDG